MQENLIYHLSLIFQWDSKMANGLWQNGIGANVLKTRCYTKSLLSAAITVALDARKILFRLVNVLYDLSPIWGIGNETARSSSQTLRKQRAKKQRRRHFFYQTNIFTYKSLNLTSICIWRHNFFTP